MSALLLSKAGPAGSASTWTPSSVSGLVGWWDASDADNRTIVSSAFSQISDKSGNGNHLTQSTSGKRPSLQTDATSGREVARFDGSDDWMSAADAASLEPTQFTLLWAGVVTSYGAGFCAIIGKTNAPTFSVGYWIGSSGSVTRARVNSTNCNAGSNITGRRLFTARYDQVNLVLRADLSQVGTIALTAAPSYGTEKLVAGMTLENGTSGDAVAMDFGECLLYNSALSTTDRDAAEAYLRTKWGTP